MGVQIWQHEQTWASYHHPVLLYSIDNTSKAARSSEMLLQDRMVLHHPQHMTDL